jgi:hypothetical protein
MRYMGIVYDCFGYFLVEKGSSYLNVVRSYVYRNSGIGVYCFFNWFKVAKFHPLYVRGWSGWI